jgi:hypothetical protein
MAKPLPRTATPQWRNWAALVKDKAQAVELLLAVNHQLPKDLAMSERLQALGDASAIFLQRNDDQTEKPDGKTKLPNLEHAYKKWPIRETYNDYALVPISERKIEDSDFLKLELFNAAYSDKIGKDSLLSG